MQIAATALDVRPWLSGMVAGEPGDQNWRLVSHMDVVAAIATGEDVPAHEVAATEANTISAGDPLERAAQMMTEHAVSHLVVVDPSGGYPVGIISTLDVASAFGGSQRWGSNRKAV